MKPRRNQGKVNLTSTYTVTGSTKKLIKFEEVLKEAGYSGVMSNESSRTGPLKKFFKWITLYSNKTYAYRTTNGKKSSVIPPKVVSINALTKILKNP